MPSKRPRPLCWNCWRPGHPSTICPEPQLSLHEKNTLRKRLGLPIPDDPNYEAIVLFPVYGCNNCMKITDHHQDTCPVPKQWLRETMAPMRRYRERERERERERGRRGIGRGERPKWQQTRDRERERERERRRQVVPHPKKISAPSPSTVPPKKPNRCSNCLNPSHERANCLYPPLSFNQANELRFKHGAPKLEAAWLCTNCWETEEHMGKECPKEYRRSAKEREELRFKRDIPLSEKWGGILEWKGLKAKVKVGVKDEKKKEKEKEKEKSNEELQKAAQEGVEKQATMGNSIEQQAGVFSATSTSWGDPGPHMKDKKVYWYESDLTKEEWSAFQNNPQIKPPHNHPRNNNRHNNNFCSDPWESQEMKAARQRVLTWLREEGLDTNPEVEAEVDENVETSDEEDGEGIEEVSEGDFRRAVAEKGDAKELTDAERLELGMEPSIDRGTVIDLLSDGEEEESKNSEDNLEDISCQSTPTEAPNSTDANTQPPSPQQALDDSDVELDELLPLLQNAYNLFREFRKDFLHPLSLIDNKIQELRTHILSKDDRKLDSLVGNSPRG